MQRAVLRPPGITDEAAGERQQTKDHKGRHHDRRGFMDMFFGVLVDMRDLP